MCVGGSGGVGGGWVRVCSWVCVCGGGGDRGEGVRGLVCV